MDFHEIALISKRNCSNSASEIYNSNMVLLFKCLSTLQLQTPDPTM